MRYNKANDVEQLVTMIREIGQGRAGETGSLQAAFTTAESHVESSC